MNNKTLDKVNSLDPELATYIVISALSQKVQLETKITVGSEVGELIVQDKSLSARHCTFIKKKDVVCIIDHSSLEGTFLNKERLNPGKTYIINDNDKIRVGKLKVSLEFFDKPDSRSQEISKLPSAEDLEDPDIVFLAKENSSQISLGGLKVQEYRANAMEGSFSRVEERNAQLEPLEVEDREAISLNSVDVEEIELDPNVLKNLDKGKRSKSKKNKAVIKKKTSSLRRNRKVILPATHVVLRFFGLLVDIILCLSLLNVFLVFVDFQNAYTYLGVLFKDAYLVFYNHGLEEAYKGIVRIVPEVGALSRDVLAYKKLDDVLSFLMLLGFFRILTTLCFGVSLGNALIGVKSWGSGFKVRVLGVFREFIGFFTAPFFIFDLPTFLSKRSFKEIISCTNLYTQNTGNSFFLCLFFIPLTIILFCFTPAVKGLELLEAFEISKVQKKIIPWKYEGRVYSKLLDLSYELNERFTTLPLFQIEVKKMKERSKRYLTFGLVFIDTESGKVVKVKKVKEFSMLSLYTDFVKLNKLSQFFQPNIFSLVRDVSLRNKNFKSQGVNQNAAKNEVRGIVESIFTLDLKRIYSFIINNGPMIAGHRDFREKIETLLFHKIRKLSLLKFSNREGILTSHKEGRESFFQFMPFDKIQGQIYLFSKDISQINFNLLIGHFQFGNKDGVTKRDPIAEFTEGFKLDPEFQNVELSQKVYQRYYDISRRFLLLAKNENLDFLKKNIEQLKTVLKEDRLRNKKLLLNLTELLEAIKKSDLKFFNITKTEIVYR